MHTDATPDYQPYLRQINVWPSTNRGTDVEIHTMANGHALKALWRLIRWAQPAWSEMEIRRTPLAMALLEHAVGQPVVYAEDLLAGPAPDEVPADRTERPEAAKVVIDLETCFDALTVLADNTTVDTHPVTRARILFNALTTPI